jgi:hypothetical protein
MNITLEQQRELAELVYPQYKWIRNAESVYRYEADFVAKPFDPELDGTAEQCQQALQVILAATNHERFVRITRSDYTNDNGVTVKSHYSVKIRHENEDSLHRWGSPMADDILTAAALAILEARQ